MKTALAYTIMLFSIIATGCTEVRGVGASVTISSIESALTSSDEIPVTVTFSEAVTEFDESDLVITGATVSNFSGSGSTYTFTLTPTGETFSVQILSDAAKDTTKKGTAPSNTLAFVKSSGDIVYGRCFHTSTFAQEYKSLRF
jgi:hypothetical protein